MPLSWFSLPTFLGKTWMEDCNYLNWITDSARRYEAALNWYLPLITGSGVLSTLLNQSSPSRRRLSSLWLSGSWPLPLCPRRQSCYTCRKKKITAWDSTPRRKAAQSTGAGKTGQVRKWGGSIPQCCLPISTWLPCPSSSSCMEGLEFHCSRGRCPTQVNRTRSSGMWYPRRSRRSLRCSWPWPCFSFSPGCPCGPWWCSQIMLICLQMNCRSSTSTSTLLHTGWPSATAASTPSFMVSSMKIFVVVSKMLFISSFAKKEQSPRKPTLWELKTLWSSTHLICQRRNRQLKTHMRKLCFVG